jgi:Sec-independent protein translocase protein TatA
MFGIGFTELIVIFLAVAVFIRPDDLPAFVRKMAKIYKEAKKAYREVVSVKDEFMKELDKASEELDLDAIALSGTKEKADDSPQATGDDAVSPAK